MAKSTYTDLERVRHIREELTAAISGLTDVSKTVFSQDKILMYGVLKMVEIIGEAATYLSFKIKHKYAYIEWDNLENLRHAAVHEYADVDYDLLYDTVKELFPQLLDEIEGILEMEFGKST
jgi:uncharacterized protein with HEPN domain